MIKLCDQLHSGLATVVTDKMLDVDHSVKHRKKRPVPAGAEG